MTEVACAAPCAAHSFHVAARISSAKQKPPETVGSPGVCIEKPGSDLLSHARRAHYHRRRAFSLPSSEWDRVVPARYSRQASCLRHAGPVLPPARPASNPGCFVSTPVAFTNLFHDATASRPSPAPLHHPLAVRPLEVIWSSLTGN